MSKEDDWDKVVLFCIILLAVIALFKFLFWISLLAIFAGIIWLFINLFSGEHDSSWISVLMFVGGILLAIISYQIGYGFEKSELGKPIVDGAKMVVQVDNTLNEVEQNATNQMMAVTQQAIAEVQK